MGTAIFVISMILTGIGVSIEPNELSPLSFIGIIGMIIGIIVWLLMEIDDKKV